MPDIFTKNPVTAWPINNRKLKELGTMYCSYNDDPII